MNDTHTSVLYVSDFAWPELRLRGFTYDRLVHDDVTTAANRSRLDWYIRWLEKDPTYSPQPYEQLAEVLRKDGEPEIAARVLYESRERARREASGGRFIGMSLLKWTMGYGLGHRYFWCLWWIGFFTVFGMGMLIWDASVLPRTEATVSVGECGTNLLYYIRKLLPSLHFANQLGCFDTLAYSLQKLLPLGEFKKFDQVQLGSYAQGYFLLHRLAGYVLAGFLVAGLSGLTQKSR